MRAFEERVYGGRKVPQSHELPHLCIKLTINNEIFQEDYVNSWDHLQHSLQCFEFHRAWKKAQKICSNHVPPPPVSDYTGRWHIQIT